MGATGIVSEMDVRQSSAGLTLLRLRPPEDVLAIMLWLSLWMASGCLVLAIADGLGDHPQRRLVLALSLVIACVGALRWRVAVCATLRARPWLVLPLATMQLTVMAVDGLISGPFQAFSLTSIGIAAIVARVRTVWLCVAILDFGCLGLALLKHSPSELAASGDLGVILGVMVGNVAAAVPLILLRRRFARVMESAPQILADLRDGAPASTPALTRALDPERLALLPGESRLTPTERLVVEALASGRAPKQIAYDRGVSLATVRTHISNAKRKLGARTQAELAAMAARSDWPGGASR